MFSHRTEEGTEQHVEFPSRALNSAEKNYVRIQKGGLAIVFGVKRFQLYLYGREFTLITDHQPLTRIFGRVGRFFCLDMTLTLYSEVLLAM